MAATTSCRDSISRKTGNSWRKYKSSYNVVNRLQVREIHGSLQPSKYHFPQYRSVFGKIPGRLCIPLKDIVDLTSLFDEGHVFLGFTKDGQFILSYTLRVEADEHTALPVYVYRLHWWHFKYFEPMRKVSEVRLFGEEEIQDDLCIAVCSWPADSTKVFVYGSCPSGGSGDEKRQCYITITAVPSVVPCIDCTNLNKAASSHNNNNYFRDEDNSFWNYPEVPERDSSPKVLPRCIRHSFVVHTKYELSPPFPLFAPKFSLKRDGLAVITTGYSLIALGIKVNLCSPVSSTQSSLYSATNTATVTQTSQDSITTATSTSHGIHTMSQTSLDTSDSRELVCNLHHTPHTISMQDNYVNKMESSSAMANPQHPAVNKTEESCSFVNQEDTTVNRIEANCSLANQEDTSVKQKEVSCSLAHQEDTNVNKAERCYSMDNLEEDKLPCSQMSQEPLFDSVSDYHSVQSVRMDCALPVDNKNLTQNIVVRERQQIGEMSYKVTSTGKKRVLEIHSDSKLSDEYRATQPSHVHPKENDQIFSMLLPELRYSMTANPGSPDEDYENADSDVTCISENSNPGHSLSRDNMQYGDSQASDVPDENEPTETISACNNCMEKSLENSKQIPLRILNSNLYSPSSSSEHHLFETNHINYQSNSAMPFTRHSHPCKIETKHSKPTNTPWSQSQDERIKFNCTDSDNIGCEIDQSCPIHGATTINLTWSITSSTDLDKCNCQQRGFNYSVRRYVEWVPDSDSPLDIEDEFHSMLPLEVHGAGYSMMTRTRRSPETQGTYIEVKQLTMDAEQYISEAVRSHAKWQDRYLDFTDYDMQILDVCPDSCNVIVLILALVRAKPEYDPWSLDFETEDETPRLYQTGFKFSWNLKTGLYNTLEIEDLKEFDQAQLCNLWNPGRYLCQKLQRDWSTPQSFVRSIHVLTNEAVWKRQSLKKLVHPVHFVAITL